MQAGVCEVQEEGWEHRTGAVGAEEYASQMCRQKLQGLKRTQQVSQPSVAMRTGCDYKLAACVGRCSMHALGDILETSTILCSQALQSAKTYVAHLQGQHVMNSNTARSHSEWVSVSVNLSTSK